MQATAVPTFPEPVFDAGAPAEPGLQAGDVAMVSGDVGDDEAVRPGVLGVAGQGQRELVGGMVRRRRERGSAHALQPRTTHGFWSDGGAGSPVFPGTGG